MSSAQEAIPAPTAVTVSTAVAAPGSIDMDVSSKRPGNVLGEGSGAGAAVPRARKRRGFAQPETQTPAPGGTALLPAPTLTPVVESVGGPPAEVFPSMKPLNLEEEQRLGRARKFAFEQHLAYKELANHAMHLRAAGVPITSAISNQIMQVQQAAMRRGTYTMMGRIYVGSIGYATNLQTLTKAFTPYGTIKLVDLPFDQVKNSHKGYAFIEFDCPEAAELSISELNASLLDGREIKVGRPSRAPGSMPVVSEIINDPRNKNRIYVSNLHNEFTEEDIAEVFEAFGVVKSCKLCPDPTQQRKHRGYCFIQYEDAAAAAEAVATMNLFDLGGLFIHVRQAITLPELSPFVMAAEAASIAPTSDAGSNAAAAAQAFSVSKGLSVPKPPTSSAITTNAITPSGTVAAAASYQDDDGANIEASGEISGTTARFMMMQKLAKRQSTVVCLENMVSVDGIDEDLEDDVRGGCDKYGEIHDVVINTDDSKRVKIFVKFASHEDAIKCVEPSGPDSAGGLDGRWFDGKQIKARIYDEVKYDNREYGA